MRLVFSCRFLFFFFFRVAFVQKGANFGSLAVHAIREDSPTLEIDETRARRLCSVRVLHTEEALDRLSSTCRKVFGCFSSFFFLFPRRVIDWRPSSVFINRLTK